MVPAWQRRGRQVRIMNSNTVGEENRLLFTKEINNEKQKKESKENTAKQRKTMKLQVEGGISGHKTYTLSDPILDQLFCTFIWVL